MHLTRPLHKAVREAPDRAMTVFRSRRRSCAQFADRVSRLAAALTGLGVAPGDRVGMLALNSDRYIEYVFAALWAGGVVNPVNFRWSAKEIAFGLTDSGTKVLIVDDAHAPLAEELRAAADGLDTIIHAGEGDVPAKSLDYETLIAEARPARDALRGGGNLAALLYTGGTTGFPKGVQLSHENLYINALGLTAGAPHAGDLPGLHVAPMFHIGGLAAIFQFALRRSPQVAVPVFDPAEILRTIQEERIGDIFLVPTMLKFLIEHPHFADFDTSSLRQIRYGAAPIDSTLLGQAMEAFPGVGFMQLYGQTETGPVVSALPPEDHNAGGGNARLRSAGRPLPIAEIRIVDAQGNEAANGGVGEVVVRGPTVMRGYWNRPEETAAALRDGWMHTGDAGSFDADGYLYIVDRVKDMIVSGGENVYSAEVENALALMEGVSACAVIGIPHEEWGEAVHAVVVAHAGAHVTQQDVQAHCKALIAGYKCPRSVEFRGELPLSPAGKVLKHKLREQFWQGRERQVG